MTTTTGIMGSLSEMEAKLPPGFRFHPADDELICDYLSAKSGAAASDDGSGHRHRPWPAIVTVDLNKCEPWDLPEAARVGGKEWYFFSLRDRKYATGERTNRATVSGYWKATGKDRHVVREGLLVGMRKTLVFYQGRAPKGRKTEWVMHEFRSDSAAANNKQCSNKEDWVLCRAFYKSRGMTPKSGLSRKPETSYEDTGSSLLPPITTDTFVSYNQQPVQSGCGGDSVATRALLVQVPCFSNLQQTHCLNPLFQVPHLDGSLPYIARPQPSAFPCNKDAAMNAMLGHLAKLGGKGHDIGEASTNMADGAGFESYLLSHHAIAPPVASQWHIY